MTFGPWLGRGPAEEWRSPVSPHVVGRYERDRRDGEQRVQCMCWLCKQRCRCPGICACPAEFHLVCTSGAPRSRIAVFAAVHLHRGALALPR